MNLFKKSSIIVTSLAISFSIMATPVLAKGYKHGHGPKKAKNIIFMVPDGQGLSNVTAARIFKNGPDGAPLYQETLKNIGYQRTHSANSTVTDSAAAASAWAIGEKVVNNEISCHAGENGECLDMVPTILELAAAKGKATGLVATSQISHATPAAFGSHVVSRYCGAEIARQYIAETKVDVILGGGVYGTRTGKGCEAYDESFNAPDKRQYIIDLAADAGYTFVTNETEMNASAAGGSKKVLGMFEQNGEGAGKTPEMFWVDSASEYPAGEPTLAEMTSAALDILEENRRGLFLMIEGSQIDWADHTNDDNGGVGTNSDAALDYQLAESLGFDATVKVVLDWVNAKPYRKKNTLVIVVADHDTGGFAINGPYNTLNTAGQKVEAGWTSGDHTAVDTIIYSQGPGSEKLNAALDNTDLYYVMESVLR
jgi:alkaline phosphatase